MFSPDIFDSSTRIYVEDRAAFCRIVSVDPKEIEWFDRPLNNVGTEVNTEKVYELWRKYQDSELERSWHNNRHNLYLKYHDDPLVFGFIGTSGGKEDSPSVHVCDILLHNWRFRTTMLRYRQDESKNKTIAWIPNRPDALAVLMQFKLMMS